jgi:hypothetical protein
MKEMNMTARLFNTPDSLTYGVGRLDFNGGDMIEGGDLWFSHDAAETPNGIYELESRNKFLHLKIQITSTTSILEVHRQFKVLQRLS